MWSVLWLKCLHQQHIKVKRVFQSPAWCILKTEELQCSTSLKFCLVPPLSWFSILASSTHVVSDASICQAVLHPSRRTEMFKWVQLGLYCLQPQPTSNMSLRVTPTAHNPSTRDSIRNAHAMEFNSHLIRSAYHRALDFEASLHRQIRL
jgi:hypothetical protein